MKAKYWELHKALVIAQQRYDEAEGQAEIDARIHELRAAEIRFNAAHLEAKGVKQDAGS